MIDWPREFLNLKIEDHLVRGSVDTGRFRHYGFQLWRGFLGSDELESLLALEKEATSRPFHPVARDLDFAVELAAITPPIRDRLATGFADLLGPGMGLTGARFLRKESGESGTVSIHQDLGYHIGLFEQLSVFCSLNGADASNGALTVVPGSHHLGYLGDAGSLEKFYPEQAEVCASLAPGDALIMHCATIHSSSANQSTEARKLFEILLCPQEQPWRIDNVLADEKTRCAFGSINPREHQLFRSSRGQRLARIRKALDDT
ncbi:MAG: phytanoyl-CoA dioxygenase family protein [Pseudomonadota bacterium]